MQGFALFAENKPDNVKLYLHMGVEDVGWNLVTLAKRYDIEGRLIISNTSKEIPTDSVKRLNMIYNACDVGINTSLGEGWGLVSFEHAATGAAQVVPRHTACEELWQGAAEFLEPVFTVTVERVLTEGKFVSPEGVAKRWNASIKTLNTCERCPKQPIETPPALNTNGRISPGNGMRFFKD